MASDEYEVVVVGAGPGGYGCALRAAQLGASTACVDERGVAGGTCLNVGCIPSKALLHASHKYEEAGDLGRFGVEVGERRLDMKAMRGFVSGVVEANVKGVGYLLRKAGVEFVSGRGRVMGGGVVEVETGEGVRRLKGKQVEAAAGSRVLEPKGFESGGRIWTSTEALDQRKVPGRLVVAGGGYIGLELGLAWSRLGAEVVVLEALDDIAGGMDKDVRRGLRRSLEKVGMEIRTKTRIKGLKGGSRSASVELEGGETMKADAVLVALGRESAARGMGLEELGCKFDERGFLEVDERCFTGVEGVWGVGDAVGGAMLAHKATEEGVALAERFAGLESSVDYGVIPSVVYTHPEAASVGMTQEEAEATGRKVRIGKFPVTASGRARAMGESEGFFKLVSDAETDRLLGAHFLAPNAGELVAEAALALSFMGSAEDMARTCHAHPTLSEGVREAALMASGEPALHL